MLKLDLGPDAHLAMFEHRHAGELHALVKSSYEHIHKWSNWLKDPDRPLEHTEEWIAKNRLNYGSGNGYEIGIWYQDHIAGQIGYNYFDPENRKTEIGYWLGEQFQGKGLVTRASTALIDNGFGKLDINRIEMQCATENFKSRKIPEKLGFRLEGIAREAGWLHDRFCDMAIYAMLASEWTYDSDFLDPIEVFDPATSSKVS